MTFTAWLLSLVDPLSLITETIYNITFELIATWFFVKFAMKKHVTKQIYKEIERLGLLKDEPKEL